MANGKARLLFMDAYDSFSENIIALLRELLDVSVHVIKVDQQLPPKPASDEGSFFQQFHAIVLGPGPGDPANDSDVGLYKLVWRHAAAHQIPVLGICLGFQSLCLTYGLSVSRLELPCHGHAKVAHHCDSDIFKGTGEVIAINYNSLGVRWTQFEQTPPISRPHSSASNQSFRSGASASLDDLSGRLVNCDDSDTDLKVLAWDDSGYMMGVRHEVLPFWGLQFHPESCKSNLACHKVLQNWWSEVQRHERTPTVMEVTFRASSSPTDDDVEVSIDSQNSPLLTEFLHRSRGATRTAVQFTQLDCILPRQKVATLCDQMSSGYSVTMLESTKNGRFSIYTFSDAATWTLEYSEGQCHIGTASHATKSDTIAAADLMALIEEFMAEKYVEQGPEESPFWGGLVGYFSYELGLDLLDIKDPLQEIPDREVPDMTFMWVDRSIVVDKENGQIYVQTLRTDDQSWIDDMVLRINTFQQDPEIPSPVTLNMTSTTITTPNHDHYTSLITSCLTSLHAGNSYELCLTTSATASLPSSTPTFCLHQRLLHANPSIYSAYLSLPSLTILSSSPEQFLSWSRSSPHLHMQPMKGTLAKTPGMTPSIAAQKLNTPKESAENLMIVDLIRHDLHRALRPRGRVNVERLFSLVEAETVFQLISHVRGTVPAPLSLPLTSSVQQQQQQRQPTQTEMRRQILRHGHRALRHTLPPGSMTGAPKKRSCEILRGLEKRNRGVYSGVIGYFDVGGGGAWSVAIRCAFSPKQKEEKKEEKEEKRKWHVGAGGAITVLSDVEGEWEEMRVKMESVLRGFRS